MSNLTSFEKWVILSVEKLEKKSKFVKKVSSKQFVIKMSCVLSNSKQTWQKFVENSNPKILWRSDKFHKMGHFPCKKVGKEVKIQTKRVQWTILYSKWVVFYITQTLLFLIMAWTPISNIHQPIAAYSQKIIMNF